MLAPTYPGGWKAPTGTLRVCSQAGATQNKGRATASAGYPPPCFPGSLSPPQFKPGVGGHTCMHSRVQVSQRRVQRTLQAETLTGHFWVRWKGLEIQAGTPREPEGGPQVERHSCHGVRSVA